MRGQNTGMKEMEKVLEAAEERAREHLKVSGLRRSHKEVSSVFRQTETTANPEVALH